MSHGTASMASMKGGAQGLGLLISRIEDASNVLGVKVTSISSFLNGEELNVDVPRARCRLVLVNHINSGLVINM